METPQGEYRRNRIHLKEAAVNVVPKFEVKSIPQHIKDVQSESMAHTQEYPSNNKGNSNVLVQCVPNPQSAKVVEKAETAEPRRSSRPHKHNMCSIETASIDSIDTNSYLHNLLSNLMWYIKPPRTLQHPDTFLV